MRGHGATGRQRQRFGTLVRDRRVGMRATNVYAPICSDWKRTGRAIGINPQSRFNPVALATGVDRRHLGARSWRQMPPIVRLVLRQNRFVPQIDRYPAIGVLRRRQNLQQL